MSMVLRQIPWLEQGQVQQTLAVASLLLLFEMVDSTLSKDLSSSLEIVRASAVIAKHAVRKRTLMKM